jgi:hypothetical protein
MNKLEKQMQENITLNEGLLSRIAKLFIRGKVKRQYKKAYDIAKDDPKLQAALADMENYHERLNDIIKSLCKRNPDHPKCK